MTQRDALIEKLRELKLGCARDLIASGISPTTIAQAEEEGIINREARGI